MAYPPNPGAPTPTPTPRPVAPGFVTCADYMRTCFDDLKETVGDDEMVRGSAILAEYSRMEGVMRAAEL